LKLIPPREFKHYFASKRPGILEVFVLMEILLGIIDADPNYVDVIFIFYADPNITGKGRTKIPFRKKAIANDAEVFRKFSQEVFRLAGVEMEFDGWEIENSSREKFNFKGTEPPEYQKAAYTLRLYYLKKPIEKSVDGLLAKEDRKALLEKLAREIKNLGYEISWKHPITGADLRDICFFVKEKFLRCSIHNLFNYKSLDIEVAVKFDRIEVIFWFEGGEINLRFTFEQIKTEILKKFSPLLEKFPKFNLDVTEEYPFLFAWAIFSFSGKDRVVEFFKELKKYFLT